jgi:hypothetical protein
MTRIKLPQTFLTDGEVQIGDRATPYRIALHDMECVGEATYLALMADATLELGGD